MDGIVSMLLLEKVIQTFYVTSLIAVQASGTLVVRMDAHLSIQQVSQTVIMEGFMALRTCKEF